MKILFLGDSITEGAGASSSDKNFVNLTAQKLNAKALNYGLGGSRIARQYHVSTCTIHNLDFNLRAEIMDPIADAVVIFGGTNDFGHGSAKLGSKTDTDVFTFYGAVNTLIDSLVKKYGKEKLLFVLPLPRTNQDVLDGDGPNYKLGVKATLKDYKNIMISSLEERNVKYVDYSSYFPKPLTYDNCGFYRDGLHPNDEGHKLLAELISKDLKRYILK